MNSFDEFLMRARLDLPSFVSIVRVLGETGISSGRAVSATFPGFTTSVTVRHGLGRSHGGAFVIEADAENDVVAQAATNSESVTLVKTSTPGALAVKVWVF